MDAVKFLKAVNKICETFGCYDCPLYDVCIHFITSKGKEEKTVSIVEQWNKEHTAMTNGEKFKEVFGRTYMSLPSVVGGWLEQEYKEPKGEQK